MKTFKEYLVESTKTYDLRIKVAEHELSEADLKNLLEKYNIVSFKKLTKTPVQEHPHEFPRLKNKEVYIFDATVQYPVTFAQLEQVLAETFGIPQDHIKVKHPADPTEEVSTNDKEYIKKLSTEVDYKDDTSINKPLYGDEYNMSMFKELMKLRRQEENHHGDGKIVEMGAEDKNSPVPNSK